MIFHSYVTVYQRVSQKWMVFTTNDRVWSIFWIHWQQQLHNSRTISRYVTLMTLQIQDEVDTYMYLRNQKTQIYSTHAILYIYRHSWKNTQKHLSVHYRLGMFFVRYAISSKYGHVRYVSLTIKNPVSQIRNWAKKNVVTGKTNNGQTNCPWFLGKLYVIAELNNSSDSHANQQRSMFAFWTSSQQVTLDATMQRSRKMLTIITCNVQSLWRFVGVEAKGQNRTKALIQACSQKRRQKSRYFGTFSHLSCCKFSICWHSKWSTNCSNVNPQSS